MPVIEEIILFGGVFSKMSNDSVIEAVECALSFLFFFGIESFVEMFNFMTISK